MCSQRVAALSETLLSSFLPPAPVGSPSILLPPSFFPSLHLFPLFQSSPRSAAHTSSNIHKGARMRVRAPCWKPLHLPEPQPTQPPSLAPPRCVLPSPCEICISAEPSLCTRCPNWIFLTFLELIHSKQKKRKSCWLRQTLLTRKLCHQCFSSRSQGSVETLPVCFLSSLAAALSYVPF